MKFTYVVSSKMNYPSISKKDGVLCNILMILTGRVKEYSIPLNPTFRNSKWGSIPFPHARERVNMAN